MKLPRRLLPATSGNKDDASPIRQVSFSVVLERPLKAKLVGGERVNFRLAFGDFFEPRKTFGKLGFETLDPLRKDGRIRLEAAIAVVPTDGRVLQQVNSGAVFLGLFNFGKVGRAGFSGLRVEGPAVRVVKREVEIVLGKFSVEAGRGVCKFGGVGRRYELRLRLLRFRCRLIGVRARIRVGVGIRVCVLVCIFDYHAAAI